MEASKKSLFLSSRPMNTAVLTATSEVSTLPVTNLKTMQPARKYRANDNTYRVDIDFGEGNELACNCAVVIGHNGTETATVQVLGGDNVNEVNGIDTADVDSGIQSAWPALSGKPTEEDWPQYSSIVLWDNDQDKRW